MDGPRDDHTKSERERQIPYAIIHMCNLKYDTNELNLQSRNRLTDMVTEVELGWGRDKLGVWDQQI